MSKIIKKTFTPLTIGFILCIAALYLALFFQFTVDDAYITFRHSANLLFNGNLSWNIRGSREEAFTNPLYVFLGIFGLTFNVKPELPIKLFSLSVLLFWFYRLTNICRPLNTKKLLFVAFLFFCCPLLYVHTFSGLETILFAYCVFEFFVSNNTNLPKDLAISSLALSCRPEGILFLSYNLILRILPSSCRQTSSPLSREDLKASSGSKLNYFLYLAVFVVVCAIYAYKFYWFADILPNTFYAKSSKSTDFITIITNVIDFLPWAILSFLASTNIQFRSQYRSKLFLILIITLLYLKSSLTMNYLNRFWFQIYFPLIIYHIAVNATISSPLMFVKVNASKLNSYLRRVSIFQKFQNLPFLVTVVITGYSILSVIGSLSEYLYISVNFGRSLRSHYALGKALNKILPPDSSIMAGDVGLIAFYSNRLMYDLNGLGTRLIATQGVTNQSISKLRPETIILYGHGCNSHIDSRHDVELDFINKNKFQYIACFHYANKESSHVYISPELLNRINVYPLIRASEISRINKRSSLSGFIDDLKASYSYLFTKIERP